jgi:hypothetical protein
MKLLAVLSGIILIPSLLGTAAHADLSPWERTDSSWGARYLETERRDNNWITLSTAGNTSVTDPDESELTSGYFNATIHAEWGGNPNELISWATAGVNFTVTFSPTVSPRDPLQYIVTAVATGSFSSRRGAGNDAYASGPGIFAGTDPYLEADDFSANNGGITVTAPGSDTNPNSVIFNGTFGVGGTVGGIVSPSDMDSETDADMYVLVNVATPPV